MCEFYEKRSAGGERASAQTVQKVAVGCAEEGMNGSESFQKDN
jgi:hypothetical protein